MRYLLSLLLLLSFSCICFAGDIKSFTEADLEQYKSANEEDENYPQEEQQRRIEEEKLKSKEEELKHKEEELKRKEYDLKLKKQTENKRQIRVRTFDQARWGGDLSYGWIKKACYEYCNEFSTNVDEYLQGGWQVVGSQQITISKNPIQIVLRTGWCQCFGVEYILESGN